MSHRVTCPHCDTALHVLDWATTPSVTCPRCMGRIPNPAFSETTSAPATGRAPSGAVVADDDVRRDSTRSGCGVTVLIVLAVIGVGSTLLVGAGFAEAAVSEGKKTLVAAMLVFSCLGLMVAGGVLVVAHRRERVRQAGTVFLWLFALIGAVVLSMVALVVVLILVCTAVWIGSR